MNDIHSKRCSKCAVCQPLSEYFMNRGKPMARCKTCHQAGIGSNAKWTDAENGVISAFYPTGGAKAVRVVLKNRSISSITKQANRLGVVYLTAGGVPILRPERDEVEPNVTAIPYQKPEHVARHIAWQRVRVPTYVTGNLCARLAA